MINISMNKGGVSKFNVAGDVVEITSDMVMIYQMIYAALLNVDEKSAQIFDETFTHALPELTKQVQEDDEFKNAFGGFKVHGTSNAFMEFMKKAYKQAEGFEEDE